MNGRTKTSIIIVFEVLSITFFLAAMTTIGFFEKDYSFYHWFKIFFYFISSLVTAQILQHHVINYLEYEEQ